MGGSVVTGGGHHGCWFVLSNQRAGVEAMWRSGRLLLPKPPLSTNTTNTTSTIFFWSMSFLTIDSSLNNHYSQLDMKWVDPAGPLIARSIGDHKIPVSSPEGSISIKSVTLTESKHIMILRGQQVQEWHILLLIYMRYTLWSFLYRFKIAFLSKNRFFWLHLIMNHCTGLAFVPSLQPLQRLFTMAFPLLSQPIGTRLLVCLLGNVWILKHTNHKMWKHQFSLNAQGRKALPPNGQTQSMQQDLSSNLPHHVDFLSFYFEMYEVYTND